MLSLSQRRSSIRGTGIAVSSRHPVSAELAGLAFGALALGTLIVLTAQIIMTTPAAAYDDDVDVVCYDINGGSEVECATIAELTAECALADPEYTTDPCAGLLENRVPVGLTLTTKKRGRDNVDQNEDKDRGRDNGRDGGRDGGGSDGGGSNGGGQKGPND